MKALLLVPLLALVSCSTTPPAPAGFVKAVIPEREEDVSPVVSEVRKVSAEADTQGEVARAHVAAVAREAAALKQGLALALEEADRLRKQKTATAEDLDGMWQSLQALTVRNLFLEEESVKAAKSLEYEKQLRKAAAEGLFRAEELARQKEAEATTLRLQLIDSEAGREAVHASNVSLSKAAASASSRADNLAGEIRVHWYGHGIAAVVIIALIAFIIFRPRFL